MASAPPALSPAQIRAARAMNDARYRGWSADRVVRLHERTAAADADGGAAYLAGIRTHLASGLYRAIYPPHVVEATRVFLAKRAAAHGG